MKIFKLIVLTIFLIYPLSVLEAKTVEEIIKGRKAMFSENYQNGKKISVLLKSGKKELMWSNCSACHNRFRAEH